MSGVYDLRRMVIPLALISSANTACGVRGGIAPILLFNGTGSSPNDVRAVEHVLNSNHLDYSTVSSSQLNGMGELQIRGYRLLIVPGGDFIQIGTHLTASTTGKIRNAVQNGLNYLGI